jgi:hypothetical protein
MDAFILKVVDNIINPLIYFLFALAILFFLYGMLEFILNQESEEAKTTGRSHMLWGIVGITIMMGVWFIMNLIINTFNIEGIKVDKGNIEVKLDDFPEGDIRK